MSTLYLSRSKDWISYLLTVQIYLDEEKVDSLRPGKQTTISVDAGEHTLYVSAGIFQSPVAHLQVRGDETGQIQISAFPFARQAGWLILIITGIHLLLTNLVGIPYVILLLIPVVLYLLYFFTLGANEFFRIEVISEYSV